MEPPRPATRIEHDHPVDLTCPHCKQKIMTRVAYVPGVMTWLVSGVFCCSVCLAFACGLPFFIDALKDAEHYCPNCNALLGIFRRL